jgi:hypothetical protein
MEHDRSTERPMAMVHRITRKRIEMYAEAEDIPVTTAAARLVRAGLERHAFIDRERIECSRRVFNENYLLPPSPAEGEGIRVKVPLEPEELSRIKTLAIREFETTPTILNRLLLWGFYNVPHSPGYSRAWNAYFNERYEKRASASAEQLSATLQSCGSHRSRLSAIGYS